MRRRLVRGVIACALAAAGCGRVGFAPLADAAPGNGSGSGSSAGDADSGTAQTETFTLPAVADTALNSFAPSLNYGGASAFNVRSDAVSTFTALVRFDLAGITGSVTATTLRIRTSNQALSSGRVEIARVREAWNEGTQNGGTGVANYGVRQGVTAWTSVGCGPGSRDTTAIGELQPFATDTMYEASVAPDIAQQWVVDPASNNGIALVAVGTGADTVTFHSRESGMGAELVVEVAP